MATTTTNTTDLADFGTREIRMARNLLDAWLTHGLPDHFEHDGVTVMFNPQSGWVFLTNAEYQVAVMEDGDLVSFHTSPYGAYGGTLVELNEMSDAAKRACDRLRGQLRNSSPRREYFRLTRAEAEALAALDLSESKRRHPSVPDTTTHLPNRKETK